MNQAAADQGSSLAIRTQKLNLWYGTFLSLIHISEPTRPKR